MMIALIIGLLALLLLTWLYVLMKISGMFDDENK